MSNLYEKLKSNIYLNLFVIFTRYLIGFAFVPSGLTKLLGLRFTVLPVTHPVGYFFETFYQFGLYWNFLGLVQVVAGFLLITQRFSTLGAILFSGIMVNIWMITFSIDFGGTIFITTGMLLASFMLLAWDWDKLQVLFISRKPGRIPKTYSYTEPDITPWSYVGLYLFGLSIVAYSFMGISRFIAEVTLISSLILGVTPVIVLALRELRRKSGAGKVPMS